MKLKFFAVAAALAVIAAACSSGDSTTAGDSATDTAEPTVSTSDSDGDEGPVRTIAAVAADGITVDGDAADWADVEGLDMTLEAISDESVESHDATVKVAHDGTDVYVLFQVDDDYNFDPEDGHLSGAAAVQWAIDSAAAEHMGAEDDDRDTSFGMVDIWHWELECAAGEQTGGAVSEPGVDHDPGNDSACNFDDEWATIPTEREDDNTDTGENSLLGVWTHTASTADEAGTWTFEMSRPLDTGDSQDAQFAMGSTARLAVAYWDADNGPDGWEDEGHVQSANQGWIEVAFS